MGSGGNGNGNGSGIGRSLPPLAPPSPGEVAMASGSGGRMLRASDLVRANSTASTEEPALMRRHSSSTGGLPSSLLQGFGNTQAPSPASSEEALFRGHLMGVPLPGMTYGLIPSLTGLSMIDSISNMSTKFAKHENEVSQNFKLGGILFRPRWPHRESSEQHRRCSCKGKRAAGSTSAPDTG